MTKSEPVDNDDCYVVESIPVDEATRQNNGYSRKVNWIDKNSFLERKVVYYDLAGSLLKTQIASDQKLIQPEKQRWMPMQREMVNNQTGHKTIYLFTQISLVPQIADQVFSTRTLERQ